MGNWLRDALLKKWCEDNSVKIKEIDMNGMDAKAFIDDWREGLNREEKDMTKGARVVIKRICDELMKWCEERHVICEFATSDDEGLSATFMVDGTTLSVSHIELRDADEFSRYVKSVLFGDVNMVDKLKEEIADMDSKILDLRQQIDKKDAFIVRLQGELLNEDRKSLYGQIGELEEELESKDAYIGRLEKEDIEKAKDIVYLEDELKKLRDENAGMKYQLDIMNTKILELNDTVREKEKNLSTAADKIVRLSCTNTSLKGQIDGLRLQLKAERKSYEDLEEDYDKKCTDCINLAKNVDSEVAKRIKAQEMLKTYEFEFYLREKAEAKIEELKKENATLQYRVDALQNDRKDLLSGYKKDLDNLNNEIKRLKQQIM